VSCFRMKLIVEMCFQSTRSIAIYKQAGALQLSRISMAESTKVISPYLVKIELIIQTYCLYNHLCYGLILCSNTFSKHPKWTLFKKCFHFTFLHTGTMSMYWAHKGYMSNCLHHSGIIMLLLYLPLLRLHLYIDSFHLSYNANKNKWKSTFLKPYKITRHMVIKL